MIMHIQALVFFIFGIIAWNGIDNAVRSIRLDSVTGVYMQLSLKQLTELRVV